MATPIRLGAVSYLNAKPLYFGLCDIAPYVRLTMDVPSQLAEQLAAGELDVALIPSVEYLRGADRGYEIIPGLAIAARGPVRSVKLFGRVPWDKVDRLALDAGSRTSQVLAQIWLDAAHVVRPSRVEELPLGVSALESTADAVLVIGDRAMRVPHEPFHEVVDLAEAWHRLTGLPFVFAFWVARGGVDLGELPAALAAEPLAWTIAGGLPGSNARATAGTGRLDVLRLFDANSIVRSRGTRADRTQAVCRDGSLPGSGA